MSVVPDPERELSAGMARILAVLSAADGLSRQEIARAAFISPNTLSGGGYLDRLKSAGLIHVSGWRKNGNGFTTPIYGLGKRDDCPRPRFSAEDMNSTGVNRVLAALERYGPLPYREAAALAGLSPHTVKNSRYMDILLAQGRVHIQAWRRRRCGPPEALFAAGPGRDAARPASLTAAEKSRNFRRRQTATRSAWVEQIVSLAG